MSPLYLKSGKDFTVTTKEALDIHDLLPMGTYTIKQSPNGGEYYLEKIRPMSVPDKLYGNTSRRAERILNTYQKRPSTTGVLLAGTKGSGKTMLAKEVSRLAATNYGIPTVVINDPLCGEGFNEFIQSIEQPLVLIFDEFEKVYCDNDDQEAMLTLLDGVYSTKKLFMFTSNDKSMINDNMLNRPGRIFYSLSFHGVDEQFIQEYCADNLEDKSHIPLTIRISKLFSEFNFDMLQSMVEDMNRYDENPIEVLEYLNADPKDSGDRYYNAEVWVKNKREKFDDPQTWNGRVLSETVRIYGNADTFEFEPKHLKSMNKEDRYIYENKEKGQKLILTPIKNTGVDLRMILLEEEQKQQKNGATNKNNNNKNPPKTRNWRPKNKNQQEPKNSQ